MWWMNSNGGTRFMSQISFCQTMSSQTNGNSRSGRPYRDQYGQQQHPQALDQQLRDLFHQLEAAHQPPDASSFAPNQHILQLRMLIHEIVSQQQQEEQSVQLSSLGYSLLHLLQISLHKVLSQQQPQNYGQLAGPNPNQYSVSNPIQLHHQHQTPFHNLTTNQRLYNRQTDIPNQSFLLDRLHTLIQQCAHEQAIRGVSPLTVTQVSGSKRGYLFFSNGHYNQPTFDQSQMAVEPNPFIWNQTHEAGNQELTVCNQNLARLHFCQLGQSSQSLRQQTRSFPYDAAHHFTNDHTRLFPNSGQATIEKDFVVSLTLQNLPTDAQFITPCNPFIPLNNSSDGTSRFSPQMYNDMSRHDLVLQHMNRPINIRSNILNVTAAHLHSMNGFCQVLEGSSMDQLRGQQMPFWQIPSAVTGHAEGRNMLTNIQNNKAQRTSPALNIQENHRVHIQRSLVRQRSNVETHRRSRKRSEGSVVKRVLKTHGHLPAFSECLLSGLNLDSLPSLVVTKILSFLPVQDIVLRVRLTCKFLYHASHDPELWRNVHISEVERYATRHLMTGILHHKCYIAGRIVGEEETAGDDAEGGPCIKCSVVLSETSSPTTEASSVLTPAKDEQSGKHSSLFFFKLGKNIGNFEHSTAPTAQPEETKQSELSVEKNCVVNINNNAEKCDNVEINTKDTLAKTAKLQERTVKDYIRNLTINNEPIIDRCLFICDTKGRRVTDTVWAEGIDNIPPGTVCPKLQRLAIKTPQYDSSILDVVCRHPWLQHLSVNLWHKKQIQCPRIMEADLIHCYEAFMVLQNLRTFKFVFPTCSNFNNNIVMDNRLFFNNETYYKAADDFFRKCGQHLEEIEITDVNTTVLKTILNSCRQLRSLSFKTHLLRNDTFYLKNVAVPSLQSLVFNCTLKAVSDKMARDIATLFPSLKTINLTDTQISEEAMAILLSRCLCLENIHLTKPLDDFPRGGAANVQSATTLAALCSSTRVAPLRELSCTANVDDTFLRKLCEHNGATLTYLSLSLCIEEVSNAFLRMLPSACPQLQHLKLISVSKSVTADGILNLIQHHRGLRTLEVSSYVNIGRFTSRALTSVSCFNDVFARSSASSSFAEMCNSDVFIQPSASSSLPQISHFDIFTRSSASSSLPQMSNCHVFTGPSVNGRHNEAPRNAALLPNPGHETNRAMVPKRNSTVSASLTKAQWLKARNGKDRREVFDSAPRNRPSNDSSLRERHQERDRLQSPIDCCLQELVLSKVPQMDALDIDLLTTVCSRLTTVALFGCFQITDCAIRILLMNCPYLRSLTIEMQEHGGGGGERAHWTYSQQRRGTTDGFAESGTACGQGLTSATLQHISQHGRQLQHFSAYNCYAFTSSGLARLLVYAVSLRDVIVTWGPRHALDDIRFVMKKVQRMSTKRTFLVYRHDQTIFHNGGSLRKLPTAKQCRIVRLTSGVERPRIPPS